MRDIQGHAQELLDDLVASGAERGMQLAVYVGDELVVDAWAGVADPATGRRVDGDTLFPVFSTTKGIVATAIHMLADRGALDYDSPIASYWPEFGAHGKERVTVRHALAHTAGVPQMPEGVGAADMCDWDGMCRAIAGLAPLWEPGAATGYHALTIGWILGETARRVDGRPIARIVRDDICAPLGITSLYIGIPDSMEARVAILESAPAAPVGSGLPLGAADADAPPPGVFAVRAIPPALQPLEEMFGRPDVRRAVIPAAGGIMNARAIARHYAALAAGELDGVRLLTAERVRLASALQTKGSDLVAADPIRKGLGYFLDGPHMSLGGLPAAFGHPGHGGSLGFADPAHRLAFGLTKNRIVDGPPNEHVSYRIVRAVRDALHM